MFGEVRAADRLALIEFGLPRKLVELCRDLGRASKCRLDPGLSRAGSAPTGRSPRHVQGTPAVAPPNEVFALAISNRCPLPGLVAYCAMMTSLSEKAPSPSVGWSGVDDAAGDPSRFISQ
jgi:hypothetical protein